jgi:hypothetical protein
MGSASRSLAFAPTEAFGGWKGPFGYHRVNVAEQRRDPGSLVNCTERLIRLRKECPEFGWGDEQLALPCWSCIHSTGTPLSGAPVESSP